MLVTVGPYESKTISEQECLPESRWQARVAHVQRRVGIALVLGTLPADCAAMHLYIERGILTDENGDRTRAPLQTLGDKSPHTRTKATTTVRAMPGACGSNGRVSRITRSRLSKDFPMLTILCALQCRPNDKTHGRTVVIPRDVTRMKM